MRARRIFSLCLAAALGGCALSQSTDQIVLDYNRDFAKSRNEVLLLNVLRAAAREPLQFSTMGQVAGQIGNSGSLKIPFTNLVAGGGNIISPELTLSDGVNPTVTITPLSGKEFANGFLRPMGPDTIQLFLHNGWDAEFLLPLVVGQVVCADGSVLFNTGEYLGKDGQPTELHLAFMDFFGKFAPTFVVGRPVERSFTLPDKELLEHLKNGTGANVSIIRIDPSSSSDGKRNFTIQDSTQPAVQGDPEAIATLCGRASQIQGAEDVERAGAGLTPLTQTKILPESADRIAGAFRLGTGPRQPRIIFRSAASVVQYLGESHRMRFRAGGGQPLRYTGRDGGKRILFKVDWGLERDPKAVRMRFHETMFYVRRIDLRAEEGGDRTLKTFAFLDQLIALQTSESSIRGAQPVFSVNQ